MKIHVEAEKIVQAVKKLEGIEIVLENPDDATEAIDLILAKTGLQEKAGPGQLLEVKVSVLKKYETSAVNYKMVFLLEFVFQDEVSLDLRVAVIKELQEFFQKV
jgi:hypothetical protein